MKNKIVARDFWFIICVNIAMIFCLTVERAVAQSQSSQQSEGILFLQLHIDNSGVSLIGSRIAEGRLKTEKIASKTEGLALNVSSLNQELIFSRVVENPLIKRYEYEDPDNAGKLITKIVLLEEAEFWVRVPYFTSLKSIAFSLTDDQPNSFAKGKFPAESIIDLSFITKGSN